MDGDHRPAHACLRDRHAGAGSGRRQDGLCRGKRAGAERPVGRRWRPPWSVRCFLWRVSPMARASYPLLFQINTRVWLTELSHALRRPATLDDIPDAELDRLSTMCFDWIWFLSVFQTGPAGQRVSRTNAEWRREFEETLPDLR